MTYKVNLGSFKHFSGPIVEVSEEGLYENLNTLIEEKSYSVAVDRLIFYLTYSDVLLEKEHLYFFIKKLLPYHSESQFTQLCERLPRLLSVSQSDQQKQYDLAMSLADRFIAQTTKVSTLALKISLLINAMHYFAQASRMELVRLNPTLFKECHLRASKIFILLIKEYLVKDNSFQSFLDRSYRNNDGDRLQGHLRQIEELKGFCCDQKDQSEVIDNLYDQAIRVANSKLDRFQNYFSSVFRGMKKIKHSTQFRTQSYKKSLEEFRKAFSAFQNEEDTEILQSAFDDKFRLFFKTLLEDALAILGPAPCCFDIRAMGSIGRGEICPYSDIEFMILIEKSDQEILDYFKLLVKTLELQIAFLGETPGALQFDFSCLHPPQIKGFHVDQSPSKEERLINTPSEMAKLQKEVSLDGPMSIQHTILKSRSLYTTDPTLYERYREEIKSIISLSEKDPIKERASSHLKVRQEDYTSVWGAVFPGGKSIINLKKSYAEPIFHLLGDLALHSGIEETNTFAIIQKLTEKGFFTQSSAKLLRKAVSFVYRLRTKLHLHYKQQQEEICLFEEEAKSPLYVATKEEVKELEKIYWHVIYPLYHRGESAHFDQVDLVYHAFTQAIQDPKLISDRSFLIPLVSHTVRYLEGKNASLNEHITCYNLLEAIPKGEILRQTYIDALENELIRSNLSQIPNRDGMRQLYRLHEKKLSDSLWAITTDKETLADPYQVKVEVPGMGARFLLPDAARELLDDKGNIRSMYESKHEVAKFEWGGHFLHFKMFPSHPLMEFAVHNLLFRIAGYLSPSTQLARFEVTGKEGKKIYPVLISQTIPGKTLSKSFKEKDNISNINVKQWSWLILCSLLVKVGDGRLSNYVLNESQELFSIDNDIAFVEPLTKEGLFSSKVNFCCSLFLLFQKFPPLDPEVAKEFLSLESGLILGSWMEDVLAREKEYMALFPDFLERKELYAIDRGDKKEYFTPTILFAPGALATLQLQWQRLKNHFESKNREIDTLELLKQIITMHKNFPLENAIGNKIYRSYLSAAKDPSIEKRLAKVNEKHQDGSLTLVEYQKVSLGKIPTIEEVESRKYSPEQAKRELLATILQSDGQLILAANEKGQRGLQGNFEHLRTAEGPDLVRQDFVLRSLESQFRAVTPKPACVVLRYCDIGNSSNMLPFLHKDLEVLDLRNTSVTAKMFSQIQLRCPHLKELYISHSPLKTVSSNFLGSSLEFQSLEKLHMTDCPELASIKLVAPKLSGLVAANNPKLAQVELAVGAFPSIDLAHSSKVDLWMHDLKKICHTPDSFIHAKKCYEQLYLMREGKVKDVFLEICINLGWIYENLKEYPLAKVKYLEALEISKKTQDKENLTALTLLNLSHLSKAMGDASEAEKFLEECKKWKDRAGRASIERNEELRVVTSTMF